MDTSPEASVYRACIQTQTLSSLPCGEWIARGAAAAIRAVDPYPAVAGVIQRDADRLTIGERSWRWQDIRQIRVIGAGKAAEPMLRAVMDCLGDRISVGAVITKHAHASRLGQAAVLEGGHPVPTQASVDSARAMTALLADLQPNDLVLCLISGGGSALMISPLPGISLDDLQSLTRSLLACGASISEMNALRKHLDMLKGGGLARLAAPAQVVTLVLSDVIGNSLDVIASGPTTPDVSTFADAWHTVEKYGLASSLPAAISAALRAGLAGIIPETPKPGDAAFERVHSIFVGSNYQAAMAALNVAGNVGFHPMLLTTYLQGEARSAGQLLAALARQIAATGQPVPRPAWIAIGGETTVTLHGSGLGGRNLELALGAVTEFDGIPNAVLITLATDGEDGPTDAAGAVVSGETLSAARQKGLHPAAFLANHDSYRFFEKMGDILRPGSTGTNVNDLAFLVLW